jgi:hypothetical protein
MLQFTISKLIRTEQLQMQETKLNIEADKLAQEAYSSSTFYDKVPMIPGVSAQLLIDGKTIVSKHRVIAHDIQRTKASKLQIQEQTGMTDQALKEVDWDSRNGGWMVPAVSAISCEDATPDTSGRYVNSQVCSGQVHN